MKIIPVKHTGYLYTTVMCYVKSFVICVLSYAKIFIDFDVVRLKVVAKNPSQKHDEEPPSSGSFMTYLIVGTVVVVSLYVLYHNRQKV